MANRRRMRSVDQRINSRFRLGRPKVWHVPRYLSSLCIGVPSTKHKSPVNQRSILKYMHVHWKGNLRLGHFFGISDNARDVERK